MARRRCKNPKCQFVLERNERRSFCASCWAAGRWGALVTAVLFGLGELIVRVLL